jgi:hypothetical protein
VRGRDAVGGGANCLDLQGHGGARRAGLLAVRRVGGRGVR